MSGNTGEFGCPVGRYAHTSGLLLNEEIDLRAGECLLGLYLRRDPCGCSEVAMWTLPTVTTRNQYGL